jgi:hypothetical protein
MAHQDFVHFQALLLLCAWFKLDAARKATLHESRKESHDGTSIMLFW